MVMVKSGRLDESSHHTLFLATVSYSIPRQADTLVASTLPLPQRTKAPENSSKKDQ